MLTIGNVRGIIIELLVGQPLWLVIVALFVFLTRLQTERPKLIISIIDSAFAVSSIHRWIELYIFVIQELLIIWASVFLNQSLEMHFKHWRLSIPTP